MKKNKLKQNVYTDARSNFQYWNFHKFHEIVEKFQNWYLICSVKSGGSGGVVEGVGAGRQNH